ncbi:hypothetical protein CUP0694 [Campylobacter upsaliensis RM3195]|nr:hypothetical protein CUP0694 [Campylobacter upsaliensis RM3195]
MCHFVTQNLLKLLKNFHTFLLELTFVNFSLKGTK